MKIGIFFGGVSREREVSFLGGKTAFENLDVSLFTPVPVFVDGKGNFILLNPTLMYQPNIRSFYPPQSYLPDSHYPFQVYSESLSLSPSVEDEMIATIGTRIYPHQFANLFDFVFIAMHGPGSEDGSIQGLLEWYGVPFNGPDVLSSGISLDKIYQNYLIEKTVGLDKRTSSLQKDRFLSEDIAILFEEVKTQVGLPFVVKAPHQGSSIGVSFVKTDEVAEFEKAVKQCLFIKEIESKDWIELGDDAKGQLLQKIANLDEGIGFPVSLGNEIIGHPQILWEKLDQYFTSNRQTAILTSIHTEDAVLFEAFVNGQEFSCGVIQDLDGEAFALPPTEIVKLDEAEVFDFQTKYVKSTTRKNIPIDTTLEKNQKVQQMVRDCFVALKFGACTRIDGFLTPDGNVLLHDPNTIPGMSPASLIFKQMAEIGFNVTDALTYFIRQSIRERIRTGKFGVQYRQLLAALDQKIADRVAALDTLLPVVLTFSTNEEYAETKKEYAKLSASGKHKPVVIFEYEGTKWQLPVTMMFKETVADLSKALTTPVNPLLLETRERAKNLTIFYTGKPVDEAMAFS
jgi:D-alanine-D-alanine ligase